MEFAALRRDSLVRYLQKNIAGEVRFDDVSRRLYSTDASHYLVQPLGVVVPKTEDDLAVAVQIASELNIPITARGAGTSLSGQAIGPGLVIDCSKFLNCIGPVDTTARRVRVQPGVVLDQLNRELAPHGLMFGPEVATASRATLGGMIGNNSAGSRSIVNGRTVDHVVALRTVLSDGTAAEFRSLNDSEFERKLELRTREGDAYRAADRAARTNAAEIVARTPKIQRRVSGYDLYGILASGGRQPPDAPPEQWRVHQGTDAPRSPISLVPLLVGSEGTLGLTVEAELNLIPRPKHRGLLVPQFATLAAALDTLEACLELAPSAVELLDRMLIELAGEQRSLKHNMAAIQGRPEALFMVEFASDDAADVSYRVHELERRLRGVPGLIAAVPAIEPAIRDPLWSLRESALPLLFGMVGDRKPVTFVEDCAVDPHRLPEFTARFRETLQRHGTDGAFYGHASVGCLHIRPVLNLHDPADVRTMRAIMTDISDLVLEFGGSLSGEHGDGMVRSEWNRKMFGPAMYDAFKQVKRGFDPGNVLNPGRIVDGPAMEENFRTRPGAPRPEPKTAFDYSSQGGWFRSIELCNGVGVCRKTQGGAMCPSYRATKDERDTTRARANALRMGAESGDSRWVAEVMDLCLSCKACKSECPSNVDMAKLKAEHLNAEFRGRPRPLGHLLVKNIDWLSPMAARFGGFGNWLGRRGISRRMMEWLAGFDRRRSLPEMHRRHFRKWFAKQPKEPKPRTVVLLDDCFTTFQEPQIGQAAVTLLERAGFSVQLAGICCGRAMISKGFLGAARKQARDGIAKLDRFASAGVPILGVEPSCLLTLADEWPDLVPGEAAKRVAASAELAESFLARESGDTPLSLGMRGPALFHGHCHQKALVGVGGSVAALKLAPNLDVTVLDAGCCGMAGSFGYEKEHFDVSVRIANLALLPALKANPEATIIATGTSCRHQIRDLTGRRVLHPLEVLEAR
jgi:FAD/FMN-containing dehydrogenase/Fe-S oxidoreductase